MGLSTILSNRSVALDYFYYRPNYPGLIVSGNFTLVLTVPAENYYDLSLFTSSGGRVTMGWTTTEPFYQFLGASTMNTFNTNNKFILPPNSNVWIDNSNNATLLFAGTIFKVTP
jgi:hypothetical protein